jgi:hypothetical protein
VSNLSGIFVCNITINYATPYIWTVNNLLVTIDNMYGYLIYKIHLIASFEFVHKYTVTVTCVHRIRLIFALHIAEYRVFKV